MKTNVCAYPTYNYQTGYQKRARFYIYISPHAYQSNYFLGKTFCFLFSRANIRNRSMLFDGTLIELFHTGIVLKVYYA